MTPDAAALVARAIEQRAENKLDQALASALAAVQHAPNSDEAWWQVAVSRLALRDYKNAIPALEKVIELEPASDGALAQLGRCFANIGALSEAEDAFTEAIEWNDENVTALRGLATIYQERDEESEAATELDFLLKLDTICELSSRETSRLGALNFRLDHYLEAIKFWRRHLTTDESSRWFNLGLAYNATEISQDADAVDMWRTTLHLFPDHARAQERIESVLPGLQKLALNASASGDTLLSESIWYDRYLNPYELLNAAQDSEFDQLDSRTLATLKKRMLHEIDLEDGKIEWLGGALIDRSRALAACEELLSEERARYHWKVFKYRPLLEFLTRGCHAYFHVGSTSPTDLILDLEVEGSPFRAFLSEAFPPQLDRLICKAIEDRNLTVLEVLLDGRRWVSREVEHRCFANSRGTLNRYVEPLVELAESESEKPSASAVKQILQNASLPKLLNLLPAYFEDLQSKTVKSIRQMAVACVNDHDDVEEAGKIIALCHLFHFKGADLQRQVEEDAAQIEQMLTKEREHEAHLTVGGANWSVTKDGVSKGDQHIAASSVVSLRWGIQISREVRPPLFDFLFGVTDDRGRELILQWKTNRDVQVQQEFFNKLMRAMLQYIFPQIVEAAQRKFDQGRNVTIGPCVLNSEGISFRTRGWFSSSDHFVPWARAATSIENGEMLVWDTDQNSKKVQFDLRETDNAPVIAFLVRMKSGRNT